MSGDLLARAFELFAQETRAFDRAQGGLGIGLTLVKTLVKMHGGSVHAFSEGPGRGTELMVRLPLGAAATSARGARGRAPRPRPRRSCPCACWWSTTTSTRRTR